MTYDARALAILHNDSYRNSSFHNDILLDKSLLNLFEHKIYACSV